MNSKRSTIQLISNTISKTFQRRYASVTAKPTDLNSTMVLGNPKIQSSEATALRTLYNKSIIPSKSDLVYFFAGSGVCMFLMYQISTLRNNQINANHTMQHDLEEKLHHEEEERHHAHPPKH